MLDEKLPRAGDVWRRNYADMPILIVVSSDVRDGWVETQFLRETMKRTADQPIDQFMNNHELFYRREA